MNAEAKQRCQAQHAMEGPIYDMGKTAGLRI